MERLQKVLESFDAKERLLTELNALKSIPNVNSDALAEAILNVLKEARTSFSSLWRTECHGIASGMSNAQILQNGFEDVPREPPLHEIPYVTFIEPRSSFCRIHKLKSFAVASLMSISTKRAFVCVLWINLALS